MAEIVNRAELEKAIAKAIGEKLNGKTAQLIKLLGDPPRLERVPMSFWDELGTDLSAAIRPQLKRIFEKSAERLIVEKIVGVDWALVNQAASEWSKSYTFELVKDILEKSKAALQTEVSKYFETQMTLGELSANLEPIFREYRSALIAITETTRASVEGEKQTVDLIRSESGIRMVPIFRTEKDETVCPVCAPMDGKVIEGSGYPPLHPNCRCFVTYEFEGSND